MIQKCIRLLKYSFFVASLFALPLYAATFTVPGSPSGYVNDFAGVLDGTQKNALESKLSAFNASTTNEIAVVIVPDLRGDYIEHYAVELYKAWGIGTKKNDNGVLLLVAVKEHLMRIEVGYGLEGALTDSIAAAIIRDDLAPAFRQNNYYEGIERATDDIIRVTKGEYTASGSGNTTTNNGMRFSVEGIAIFGIVVLQFLSAIFGRSKSWWAGGVVGGLAGGALMFFGVLGVSVLVGGIVTVVLAALGLLFDYIVSTNYAKAVGSGSRIPWWIGGRGGSGGSRVGASFGGFGGGRSGGGGASGSW